MSMVQICSLFGISRQAHYQRQCRERVQSLENEIILEMVRQVRRRHPRMGCRKVLYKIRPMLAQERLKMGRDRLFRLLREANLLVKPRKGYRRTTYPGLSWAPNRLPGLVVTQCNQVWVCDITYLALMKSRFAYLFLLMDLYSRYIIGWHVSPSLGTNGALVSLDMALSQKSNGHEAVIHHSDHGVQYTNRIYQKRLLENNLLASMGAVGNCYDNIYAERVIGSLKNEYGLDLPFVNISHLSPVVKEVINLYNADRPHQSLGMATPKDIYEGKTHNVVGIKFPLAV